MFLHDHPALARIPAKHLKGCLALWALAQSWSRRWSTDGFVSGRQVELLGGTRGEAALLVSSGLWEDYEDGYLFRTWDTPASARQDVRGQSPDASADKRASEALRKRTQRARRAGQTPDAGPDTAGHSAGHSADMSGVVPGQGGKGGSEISVSSLSSPVVSPSPPGSELDLLPGCNVPARDAGAWDKPNPGRLQWELEELVRGEFASRGVTAQKASRKQWLDGCATVQEALDLGAYPDARSAMQGFASKLVDAVAAGKPEQLGFALQQVMLGEQLRPVAPRRQLSPLAEAALARRGGT